MVHKLELLQISSTPQSNLKELIGLFLKMLILLMRKHLYLIHKICSKNKKVNDETCFFIFYKRKIGPSEYKALYGEVGMNPANRVDYQG